MNNEQETIELGIVGIKNMGEYNSEMNYEKLNVVTYQGSSYCALKNSIGALPTNTEYWQLYAKKGDTGDTGATGATGPQGPQGIPGSPSGAPLAASSTADMTDTTKVYVNTTDGKWYYYDGDSWEIGGVYQATEIEDGSVTPLKTNFFGYADLLANIDINNNIRLSSTGGGSSTVQGYKCTDYIPVTKGDKIYLKGTYDRLRYYTMNKVSINSLIDDSDLSNTLKTIPEMSGSPVKYIKIDWHVAINDQPNIHLYDTDVMKQLIPIDEIKNARTINGVTYNNLYEALNKSYDDLSNQIDNEFKLYIKYTAQTQAFLTIYMKCGNYYVGYIFKHMIDASVNCNVWRLRDVHAYTKDAYNNFTEVSGELVHSASEWECAIKEKGKSFVGGSTHGYEIVTDIVFFLDNIRYDNPSDLNGLSGNELRIIRKSNLYRSDDINTIIATHYVDYLFKDNKVTIDNRINWNVDTNLGISFITMLGLKRTNDQGQVSSYGIREGDGALLNISTTPFSYGSIKKCRKAYAFNDSLPGAKTFVSVELLEDDFLPNSSFHFEGGANYNKFYFDHCGANYDISAGDIWHTKSQYSIKYLGQIEE